MGKEEKKRQHVVVSLVELWWCISNVIFFVTQLFSDDDRESQVVLYITIYSLSCTGTRYIYTWYSSIVDL